MNEAIGLRGEHRGDNEGASSTPLHPRWAGTGTFIVTPTFTEFKCERKLFPGGESVYQSWIVCSLLIARQRMHICEDHDEMLPDGVQPMWMPDTEEEANFLLCLLEAGLYPNEDTSGMNSPPNPGRFDSFPGVRIQPVLVARLRNPLKPPELASGAAGTSDLPE